MSPQTWKRVKELYASATQLPVSQRVDYLKLQAAEEPRVLAETLRLLRYDLDEAEQRIEKLRLPSIAPSLHLLTSGDLLAGRYEVIRFLAAGGFGEVYEAEDRERGQRLAIKILRPEFSSADQISWIRREVQMARRIQHPNVCRVFDVVQSAQGVFLTMELLEGETLAAFLKREGALPERRALPILRQVVAALAAAHRNGVVHRDLKPGNIMIVPRPDGPPRAVVTDFGLARPAPSDRRSTATTSAAFGTPAYMAPEQIAGKPITSATDIYALGVVLHEMVTGELPFDDESPLTMAVRKMSRPPRSPREFAPELRPTWVHAMERCLDPNPRRRFSSVEDVLSHLDSRSTMVLRWKLARRWLRAHVSWKRTLATVAAAAIAIALWTIVPRTPSPQAVHEWQQGLHRLHAGEPLEAIKHWEESARSWTLPPRTSADLALAWNELRFPARAAQSLGAASWTAPSGDRQYRAAVNAWLTGDAKSAIELLNRRAAGEPDNPIFAADLAYFESLHTKKPAATWRRVADLQPDAPAAHLQLASLAADAGNWSEAEREFLTASLYFQTRGDAAMTRAVAARRGLRLLASGDAAAARNDLLPFTAASISGAGAGPCERMVVLLAGQQDNFRPPLDPIGYVSPRFQLFPTVAGGSLTTQFDDNKPDRVLVLSFPLPPVRICSAQLEYQARRNFNNVATENDYITLGAAPFETAYAPLNNLVWASTPREESQIATLELKAELFANVQRAYANQPLASLDIHAGDDTSFDYFKLTLVY